MCRNLGNLRQLGLPIIDLCGNNDYDAAFQSIDVTIMRVLAMFVPITWPGRCSFFLSLIMLFRVLADFFHFSLGFDLRAQRTANYSYHLLATDQRR